MYRVDYAPTCKMNVRNPTPLEKDCIFIQKLKHRIQLLNIDVKLEIKNILNSSK
jgi:hypothetical protein